MRHLTPLLVAIVLSTAGCGGCPKEPGKISVEIRHGTTTHKGQLSLDAGWAAVGEGNDARRVEVKDGQLRALGRDYGAVAAGDTVVLDAAGVLTVNGQKRDPQ